METFEDGRGQAAAEYWLISAILIGFAASAVYFLISTGGITREFTGAAPPLPFPPLWLLALVLVPLALLLWWGKKKEKKA